VTDTDPYLARAQKLLCYGCGTGGTKTPNRHASDCAAARDVGAVAAVAAELRRHAEEVATFAGAGDRAIAMLVEAERERDAALARLRGLESLCTKLVSLPGRQSSGATTPLAMIVQEIRGALAARKEPADGE